jgi:ferric-dicitrate binding protein FerR (iron transport regulator)
MKQKDHNMHNQDLGNEEKEINELLADDRAIIERVAAVNVDKAWKKILYRKRSRTIFMAAKKQLKYAAVILLLVMAGYYMASYKINQEDQHVYTTFNIPNAEMGNVILPDGTQVKLNSSSELKYPLNFLSSREVFLTGEAFFDVESNPGNPFFVHVNDFSIKVTGTRFNVKAYPDSNTEMTLEEGRIAVVNHEGNTIAELKPNENLIIDKAQNGILVTTVDPHLKTDWQKGKIFLKNQPIEEIARIIERWYNVQIEFDDESIKQVKLTGTILKDKPIEQLLNVLAKSESIEFKFIEESNGNNIIHIKYKKMR